MARKRARKRTAKKGTVVQGCTCKRKNGVTRCYQIRKYKGRKFPVGCKK